MQNKGITLISLVITIILLIILAGVGISLSLGDNGIFMRVKQSKEEYRKSEIKEEIELAIIDIQSNEIERTFEEKTIIENLPNKIKNIIIDENLTGEYKNYEYWIDENYEVHIGEKLDNPIKINLGIPYVGTSSLTVNVNANSEKGKIVKYQYIVNNEIKKETTESSYTIEGLEPKTKYIISVTVIDELGNSRKSIPINVTTKERTYLIKDGEELFKGETLNATASKENNYLKIQIPSIKSSRAGYCIDYDLNNYKKVNCDMEIKNKGISSNGCSIMYYIGDAYNDGGTDNFIMQYNETSKQRDIYSLDIDETIKKSSICILKNATTQQTSATIYIYNLWIEE